MNKLNITAYMFLIWAAFSFCGCAGKEQPQMYLEAKEQDTQSRQNLETEAPANHAEQNTCFVYVCGAVKHPGVFELPEGSRVYEAIALAGGLCEQAYVKGLNQARQIADGDMIEILTIEEQRELEKEPQSAAAQDTQAQDGRIDINTATAEQLMELRGIGEAKAANIVAYRESNGRFLAPEDLMNVNGIGEGVYAKIKDKIKVIQ